MNTGESYAFGEWASKLGKLDYMVGVGAMRTYVSQGNAKQVKYIFRPTIQLGYRFKQLSVNTLQSLHGRLRTPHLPN